MSSTRCFAPANRSCELTRCCLLASLKTARSLPRLRTKPKMQPTNTRTMHNRNTHVQHMRVLRKTLCVRGLGFAFALGRGCVLERLLSVSLSSTVVRWLFIENLTPLEFCREQSPFFCEDRFVLPSQIKVFFVDDGIP